MTPQICYDCTKLATSVTEDYVPVGYSVADTDATWKYISKLGYDPDNPCVRHGVEVNASSSTGYADGQYTNDLDATSDATREWLSGGSLYYGALAGRFFAYLATPSPARTGASPPVFLLLDGAPRAQRRRAVGGELRSKRGSPLITANRIRTHTAIG